MEDTPKILIADLSKRRVHHENEADGDRDIGRAALKLIDKGFDFRKEIADQDADGHRQKNP